MSVCTYDFVMSDQNFILTFLVLALRVIVRFSYGVVSRWNERWLGNITSATDHELWRCKGKKNVSFPIAFPSGSGRRALILHFRFIFDDWISVISIQNTGLFANTVSRAKTLANPSSRLVVNSRIREFCLFPNSAQYFGQIPYPENTLPDPACPFRKKWVTQSQNHAAWYQKFSSVKKKMFKK